MRGMLALAALSFLAAPAQGADWAHVYNCAMVRKDGFQALVILEDTSDGDSDCDYGYSFKGGDAMGCLRLAGTAREGMLLLVSPEFPAFMSLRETGQANLAHLSIGWQDTAPVEIATYTGTCKRSN